MKSPSDKPLKPESQRDRTAAGLAAKAANAVKLPDVLNYTDYRQFLLDYYHAHKQATPRFSLRTFAKKVGFPSHGLLKYLMEGQRNLSQKTLIKLSMGMGFSTEQARYFENLVFFNQAKGLEEKNVFYERLRQSPSKSTFRKLEASQLSIFEKWQNTAVREILGLKGARHDAEWISGQLLPKTDVREIEEALKTLLSTGLIRRTANGYRPVDPDITTDDEVKSFLVKKYHAHMLQLAAWALDSVAGKDRDISSVCFAVKESNLPHLKRQIQLMRKELRNFAAKNGEGERIVQVNIQLFPLSKGR